MEDNTLFMLCDPKKCKPNNTMDAFINNYTNHNNELLTTNNDNISPNSSISNNSNSNINNKEDHLDEKEIDTKIIEEELPDFMIEVVEHINHIDNFILCHKYDKYMDKINDYLIDLLFLIKSKKK